MFLFYDSEDDMFHSRYTAFISVFWYQQKNILGYSVTVKYLMLWGSFLTVVCKDEGIFFSLFQLLGNKFWNEMYYKTVNFLIYWTIWIHVALFNQNKRINNIFFFQKCLEWLYKHLMLLLPFFTTEDLIIIYLPYFNREELSESRH